jgi:hypothetical protein
MQKIIIAISPSPSQCFALGPSLSEGKRASVIGQLQR